MQDLHVHKPGLIRDVKFLEEDGNLPWVRPVGVGEEGDGLGHVDCFSRLP